MKYPKLLCLCFLLFFSFSGESQITETLRQIKLQQAAVIDALEDISYPSKSGRVHHFYLNKNWQNSFVITLDDETIYFNGRYNVLNKTIESHWKGEQRVIYPKKIKAAQIGENLLIPIGADQIRQVDNNRYLEVLSFGKLNLLNGYGLETKMETGSSLSFQGTGKKTYFIDETLYHTSDFKTIEKLDNSKGKILDLFGQQEKAVANFAKENRLRFNNKEDLRLIFDFFNSLGSP